MSDDLVKRARHNATADMPHYASVALIEEMADRIKELEAKLAMVLDLLETSRDYGVTRQEIKDAIEMLKDKTDE